MLDLVSQLANACERTYPTREQRMAWRIGYLTALLASMADRHDDVRQELIDELLKLYEDKWLVEVVRFELTTNAVWRRCTTAVLYFHGAEERIWTIDTRIFNPLLYQLSYIGIQFSLGCLMRIELILSRSQQDVQTTTLRTPQRKLVGAQRIELWLTG